MAETTGWAKALEAFSPISNPVTVGPVSFGDGSLALIAGPCAIESEELCLSVGQHMADLCRRLDIPYVFKSSFDKANRTSINSFRGDGLETGLRILQRVKEEIGVPILTDVHETCHVAEVAKVADILQIPAFLCRQTDLLIECGKQGSAVNIKKGQFLAPDDMKHAVEKITETGNPNVLVTERGALFGYRDLIVDMRSLVIMRSQGKPVIFDATHSVQQMGAAGGSSGGFPEFIPAQVRAAAAVGVDGLFIETHPDPAKAMSDGSNMIPLEHMEAVLRMALASHSSARESAS